MFVNGLFFSLVFVLMQITTLPSAAIVDSVRSELDITREKLKIHLHNTHRVQREP